MAESTPTAEAPGIEDSETFARTVAIALFAWDTASGLMPTDHTAAILKFGDPSEEEQAGLASDIANYLPSRQAWLELRKYATRQRLTIQRSYIPAAWTAALDQARPNQLAAGTIAVTIEGTRHRTGVWHQEQVATDQDVAFTIIIVCKSNPQTCHLLRLSAPDTPLR